jgi:phosphatidylserine decarboxylase
LRQKLWSQLLKQYDTDDTRTITHLELTSMLDSLGSTLCTETIDSFYTRWNKNPQTDELTFPETIQCLETEICRPNSERRRVHRLDMDVRDVELAAGTDMSTPQTPNLHTLGTHTPPLRLDTLNFSGPPLNIHDITQAGSQAKHVTESLGDDAAAALKHPRAARQTSTSSSLVSDAETPGSSSGSGSESKSGDDAFERVINIKNCPLCHRPRLNAKAERDIVTHLAVCASQDWARVDRVMVGNFVTALQAQRKWYTNVLSKVSAGNYKIGAVRILFDGVPRPG